MNKPFSRSSSGHSARSDSFGFPGTGYYVRFRATNANGDTWSDAQHFTTLADTPPAATNVTISGLAKEGETLTGSYTYSDAQSDPEGVSTFRWLRSVDATPGAGDITVATTMGYTVQAADAGKYLFFEVTPVAATGGPLGVPVASNPTPAVGYGTYAGFQATINWAGSDSSATADADGDGSPNLAEYAFATNPIAASDSYHLSTRLIAGNTCFEIIYHENLDATDLTYTVQQSNDMIFWSTYTPAAEDIIITPVATPMSAPGSSAPRVFSATSSPWARRGCSRWPIWNDSKVPAAMKWTA